MPVQMNGKRRVIMAGWLAAIGHESWHCLCFRCIKYRHHLWLCGFMCRLDLKPTVDVYKSKEIQ